MKIVYKDDFLAYFCLQKHEFSAKIGLFLVRFFKKSSYFVEKRKYFGSFLRYMLLEVCLR